MSLFSGTNELKMQLKLDGKRTNMHREGSPYKGGLILTFEPRILHDNVEELPDGNEKLNTTVLI